MIIALDGPAASGKGTLARRLAQHYGLKLLDTGLLYRAVGLKVLAAGKDVADTEAALAAARTLASADLEVEGLRADEAAQAASKVSVIPEVRAELLRFQRDFAADPGDGYNGAILDGRDIGTVVLPDADAKLFIFASPEVRAARRVKELRERGLDVIHARVLADLKERDERDRTRATAPLVPADDAWQLDTSTLTADQVFEAAVDYIGRLD